MNNFTTEQIKFHIQIRATRLKAWTQPTTTAEIYERDMLEDDLKRLKAIECIQRPGQNVKSMLGEK